MLRKSFESELLLSVYTFPIIGSIANHNSEEWKAIKCIVHVTSTIKEANFVAKITCFLEFFCHQTLLFGIILRVIEWNSVMGLLIHPF